MATRDWPAALCGAELQFYLRKSGTQFRGLTDGSLQAIDWMGERWVVSVSLPPYRRGTAEANAAEALGNWLPGGVNRVRMWNHARPLPLGSARGAPKLATAIAKGDSSVSIVDAYANPNLVPNPGFLQSDPPNVQLGVWPAGWGPYNNLITTDSGNWSMSTGGAPSGGNFCRVQSVSGQNSAGFGIARSTNSLWLWVAHLPHVISFWARAAGPGLVGARAVGWYNNMGWTLVQELQNPPLQNGVWQQVVQLVVPPQNGTTGFGELYISIESGTVIPAGAAWDIADVQVTRTSTLQPWAGLPTMAAGDFFSVGGQLFQALDPASAAPTGVLTVQTVNRAKAAVSAADPVTLTRPSIECIMPSMSSPGTSRGKAFLPALFDLEAV